jgi:hypothetical protein
VIHCHRCSQWNWVRLQHCFKRKYLFIYFVSRNHTFPFSFLMQEKTINELIKELKALHLREAQVVSLLERAARQDSEAEHQYEPGDRIHITTRVKKPASWGNKPWDYQRSKFATVTHSTTERVYFVTDNGVNSWRLFKNVTKV